MDGCVGLLLVFGGFAVLVVFDVCWLLIMDWLIVLIFWFFDSVDLLYWLFDLNVDVFGLLIFGFCVWGYVWWHWFLVWCSGLLCFWIFAVWDGLFNSLLLCLIEVVMVGVFLDVV